MPLLTLDDVTIAFRGVALLDGVTKQIEGGERIGLLGRNGAGKTTLLRLLAGTIEPDSGSCVLASGATVALLQQDVPQAGERSAPWWLSLVGIVRTGVAATAGACGTAVASGRAGSSASVLAGLPRTSSGGREPPRCHAAAESVCRTTHGQTQLA